MADKVIFVASAFKHGCTQADIERAIKTQIYEGPLEGEDDIYAIIGFDSAANPIEIFYNRVDKKTIKVFHAMGCRDKVSRQMDTQMNTRRNHARYDR
ncbi:MAG: hypothetical protein LBT00_00335 [Spirochaetaceae bacterium]|nr:hypothetical protein [Spirochaetaceae bacterium]